MGAILANNQVAGPHDLSVDLPDSPFPLAAISDPTKVYSPGHSISGILEGKKDYGRGHAS